MTSLFAEPFRHDSHIRLIVNPLHVHLVFVTTHRRGVPGPDMLHCCQDAMRKACADVGAELREFSGEDDHVHLLAEYPPKVAVSALVNSLKGVPARRLRSEFTGRVNRHIRHGHFWSVLLCRILRRCPAEHHPALHRPAKTPG